MQCVFLTPHTSQFGVTTFQALSFGHPPQTYCIINSGSGAAICVLESSPGKSDFHCLRTIEGGCLELGCMLESPGKLFKNAYARVPEIMTF